MQPEGHVEGHREAHDDDKEDRREEEQVDAGDGERREEQVHLRDDRDVLEDLDEEALIRILTEPKNALLKQYQKLFEMDDVNLEFRDDALRAVAKKAIERKTGARGLRSIMENILMEPMFDIPTSGDIEEVVINGDVVDTGAAPLVVHAKRTRGAEQGA